MIVTDNAHYRAHIVELCRTHDVSLIEEERLQPHEACSIGKSVSGDSTKRAAIICAPITEVTTYTVALHELGHRRAVNGCLPVAQTTAALGGRIYGARFEMLMAMIGPSMMPLHLSSTPKDKWPNVHQFNALIMLQEEAAWRWAEDNALEWTPVMESLREWALQTYRKGGQDRLDAMAAAVAVAITLKKPFISLAAFDAK